MSKIIWQWTEENYKGGLIGGLAKYWGEGIKFSTFSTLFLPVSRYQGRVLPISTNSNYIWKKIYYTKPPNSLRFAVSSSHYLGYIGS
jgi:hypothetical protein